MRVKHQYNWTTSMPHKSNGFKTVLLVIATGTLVSCLSKMISERHMRADLDELLTMKAMITRKFANAKQQ